MVGMAPARGGTKTMEYTGNERVIGYGGETVYGGGSGDGCLWGSADHSISSHDSKRGEGTADGEGDEYGFCAPGFMGDEGLDGSGDGHDEG